LITLDSFIENGADLFLVAGTANRSSPLCCQKRVGREQVRRFRKSPSALGRRDLPLLCVSFPCPTDDRLPAIFNFPLRVTYNRAAFRRMKIDGPVGPARERSTYLEGEVHVTSLSSDLRNYEEAATDTVSAACAVCSRECRSHFPPSLSSPQVCGPNAG
jgi:hypothetical protein